MKQERHAQNNKGQHNATPRTKRDDHRPQTTLNNIKKKWTETKRIRGNRMIEREKKPLKLNVRNKRPPNIIRQRNLSTPTAWYCGIDGTSPPHFPSEQNTWPRTDEHTTKEQHQTNTNQRIDEESPTISWYLYNTPKTFHYFEKPSR